MDHAIGISMNYAIFCQRPEAAYQMDHLAVISCITGAPLLVTDVEVEEKVHHYYPGAQVSCEEWRTFLPEPLVSTYDVLFYSHFWGRKAFRETFGEAEAVYGKKLRSVFCSHGNSDKGIELDNFFERFAEEDISLLYGDRMIEILKSKGVFDKLAGHVVTGNYRYTYYEQHLQYHDKLVQEEVFSRFAKQQPTIFYAPTAQSFDVTSSIIGTYTHILDKLPDHYNLVVKLHPYFAAFMPAAYELFLARYEHKRNIVILGNYPLVLPLLSACSIFVGDISSVGYDCLPFAKPMFFFHAYEEDLKEDPRFFLYQCGSIIKPSQYAQFYSIVEAALPRDQELFGEIRKKMCRYVFAPKRTFEEIRKDIVMSLEKR